MKVGFTGTQNGLTNPLVDSLCQLMERLNITQFHHGDCIGADWQAHNLARELEFDIVVHPPKKTIKQCRRSIDKKDACFVAKRLSCRRQNTSNVTITLSMQLIALSLHLQGVK